MNERRDHVNIKFWPNLTRITGHRKLRLVAYEVRKYIGYVEARRSRLGFSGYVV